MRPKYSIEADDVEVGTALTGLQARQNANAYAHNRPESESVIAYRHTGEHKIFFFDAKPVEGTCQAGCGNMSDTTICQECQT